MKILHICDKYFPSMGGNQIHTQGISEKLVQLGHNVTVFTSNMTKREEMSKFYTGKDHLPKTEVINGVIIRRFTINNTISKLIFKTLPEIRGGYRLNKIIFQDAYNTASHGPFIPQIVWEMIKLKPDIVMVLNSWGAQTYYSYLAKKIIKFQFIIIPCLHIGAKWVEDPMIYKVLQSSDLIIALTKPEKEFLVQKGIDERKISVIGVGIDPYKYNGSDGRTFRDKYSIKDEPVVTYLGRKMREKGIETLIEAMTIVWKEIPNARLVLAGKESDYYLAIKNKICSLGDNYIDKVIQIGAITEEEKSKIFASCDIFAMPSKIESFGIVYLEAWMYEKPVIACRDSARSALIDNGKDGLLVEYGNKEELAMAILKLLRNENMRKELGKRGKEKVLNNYTRDIIANKIAQKYKELVN